MKEILYEELRSSEPKSWERQDIFVCKSTGRPDRVK